MARTIGKLSPAKVKNASAPGLYGDGGGLYLNVGPTGGKSWLFRFMLNGQARAMGLGPLHTIGLAEAREKATAARRLRLAGTDPLDAKHAEKTRRITAAVTLKKAAEEYVTFTAETLRAMFEEKKIIRGRMKLPSADGFRYLAAAINNYAQIAEFAAGSWRQLEDDKKKLNQALQLIDEAIPGLRAQAAGIQPDLRDLDSLAIAAGNVRKRPYLFEGASADRSPPMDTWHGYGEKLAASFFTAMRDTNPGEIGYSNGGPLGRFLVEAINHISGETPESATVVQFLRHKSRMRGDFCGIAVAPPTGRIVATSSSP